MSKFVIFDLDGVLIDSKKHGSFMAKSKSNFKV